MKENSVKREYLFDNLKFILIVLVVVGHIMTSLRSIYVGKFLYLFIYFFHMPAMIFISGYFSKKSIVDGKLVKNKIFNYILIYAIFQFILMLIGEGSFSIYCAKLGLWYLQLLIAYQLIMPVITRVKPKYLMVISILLCLLVGFDDYAKHTASLSRILVFLPIYLTGYYLNKDHISKIRENKIFKIIALLLFVGLGFFIVKYMFSFDFKYDMLYGKDSYDSMGVSNLLGVFIRSSWLVISTLLILGLITLVPSKKTFYSKFGSRTLQVYLLHLILIILLRQNDVFKMILEYSDFYVIIGSVISGILITFVLSLKIFSYPFDFLMNFKFNKFLVNEDS